MEPITRYSLEDFAERHRADFDLHEPRPEVWDAIAARLDGAADASQPRMSMPADAEPAAPVAPVATPPQLRVQRSAARWQRLGVAATLLLVLLAAGLGEVWKTRHTTTDSLADAQLAASVAPAPYLSSGPGAMLASQGGPNGNARLDTAVQGMERYYTGQLADRQSQLSQLAPADAAEWMRELVSLDSSYQQLKRELPRHPQPEEVLMAMNRNLQIRLDILDRQLELHGSGTAVQTVGSSEYALADSRSLADNAMPSHAH